MVSLKCMPFEEAEAEPIFPRPDATYNLFNH